MTADEIVKIFKQISLENAEMGFPEKWHKAKDVVRSKTVATTDFEQSWKSSSGKAFEKIAIEQVLEILKKDSFINAAVRAKRWAELTGDEHRALEVPLTRKCSGDRIDISNEPDIVIYKGNRAMAILSCKSSLRDRVSIDLFWARVNADAGRKFLLVSAAPMEELGTHEKPKKPRKIAECVYERLYIVNGNTDYCDVVRPFRDIESDLMRWFIN